MSETPRIKQQFPARAAAYVAIYPILLQIAKDHGYSLAVHGSLHRDMDLVAIPWIEEASEPLVLIKALKETIRAVTHHDVMDDQFPDCDPKEKPHGRIAYSLHFTNEGMYGGYLDISVMPCVKQKPASPVPPRPMVTVDNGITCRGCYALGNACGKCKSCADEWERLFGGKAR